MGQMLLSNRLPVRFCWRNKKLMNLPKPFCPISINLQCTHWTHQMQMLLLLRSKWWRIENHQHDGKSGLRLIGKFMVFTSVKFELLLNYYVLCMIPWTVDLCKQRHNTNWIPLNTIWLRYHLLLRLSCNAMNIGDTLRFLTAKCVVAVLSR